MISYQEYKNRVNKLTRALAMWIYKTNPSDDTQRKVMTKAHKVIKRWHDQIIFSTSPWA